MNDVMARLEIEVEKMLNRNGIDTSYVRTDAPKFEKWLKDNNYILFDGFMGFSLMKDGKLIDIVPVNMKITIKE